MTQRLIQFIQDSASGRSSATQSTGLTIGIEHEFFVSTSQGDPVSHKESQQLLEALGQVPGWHIRERISDSLGEMISRVSKNRSDGTYTTIKYDHHPHLFEIAFAYRTNLNDLNADVEETLLILQKTATSLNLQILNQPFLNIDAADPRITSELQYFRLLRAYRKNLFVVRKQVPDPALINYAAIIAATQTHIGGMNWWSNESLVSELYRYEPVILPITARAASNGGNPREAIRKRWIGYSTVFSGFPLVGYPNLPEWTLSTWVKALNQSPLARIADTIQPTNSLSTNTEDLETFMKDVRDLQIIRPRLFGTLEFRADPAMPTPKLIIAAAALRLATCIGILSEDYCKQSFAEAHKSWWSLVTTGEQFSQTPFVEKATNWLKKRKLGEESLLECLYEFDLPRAA